MWSIRPDSAVKEVIYQVKKKLDLRKGAILSYIFYIFHDPVKIVVQFLFCNVVPHL